MNKYEPGRSGGEPRGKAMNRTEGVDNIRKLMITLFEKAVDNNVDRVYAITNVDLLEHHFPEIEITSANPYRIERQIPSRLIYSCSDGPIYQGTDHLHNRQSKYIEVNTNVDLTIIGDHVLFAEMDGIVVAYDTENHDLAEQLKKVFDLLWRM